MRSGKGSAFRLHARRLGLSSRNNIRPCWTALIRDSIGVCHEGGIRISLRCFVDVGSLIVSGSSALEVSA